MTTLPEPALDPRLVLSDRVALRGVAIAVVAGLVLAAIAAAAGKVPNVDAIVLVCWAAGGSAAAGFAVRWGVGRLGRQFATRLVAVALVPVAATALGSSVAARAMFISTHDLSAMLVVVAAAGGVGVAVAWWTAVGLTRTTADVAMLARSIDGTTALPPHVAGAASASGELGALAAELAETSARLAEARSRELAMEASRRELIAWVSHDLRTPLAGIRAMAEALEDGMVEGPEEQARYHRTLRTESDRLAALVDDLFELSRIQAGALRLCPEPVDLADLLSDAVAGAQALANAAGVRLVGDIELPAPVLDLSAAEATRAVRNLLDNAIRHTPSGGEVIVRCRADAGPDGRLGAIVEVADACGGIPAEHLDRVFELAYSGDDARSPHDGRTGLGLAITKGIVEAHGGQVSVRNDGPGCRFTVRLG